MDTHIAFNDVISAVLAIVLADYGPEPGRAETIRERLTAVALTGGGLAEIARTWPERSIATSPWSTRAASHSAPAGRRPSPPAPPGR